MSHAATDAPRSSPHLNSRGPRVKGRASVLGGRRTEGDEVDHPEIDAVLKERDVRGRRGKMRKREKKKGRRGGGGEKEGGSERRSGKAGR